MIANSQMSMKIIKYMQAKIYKHSGLNNVVLLI